MERTKENTVFIYWDGGTPYLRIAPLETPRFPHGLSLATPVPIKDLPKFREDVWQYLKKAFNC